MRKKNGFTLIELLLVLAIIGLISAIAIPTLQGAKRRGHGITAQELITRNGPPDQVSNIGQMSFMYFKQPDGSTIVYTLDKQVGRGGSGRHEAISQYKTVPDPVY